MNPYRAQFAQPMAPGPQIPDQAVLGAIQPPNTGMFDHIINSGGPGGPGGEHNVGPGGPFNGFGPHGPVHVGGHHGPQGIMTRPGGIDPRLEALRGLLG